MKDLMNKVVTADEAIRYIKNGDTVVLSHAAGAPQLCIDALKRHYQDFKNVSIYHMLLLGDAPYAQPECEGHFRHLTNFVGANTRDAVAEGRADFIPMFFHEVPRSFANGMIPVDVAIVQLSYPNSEGYCSFGVSSDYSKPATRHARIVIGEINSRMPFIQGDNLIHVSELDHVVLGDYPLYEIPRPQIGLVEEAIGKNVASLIKDGDTLQLGIGAIPDAVLMFLNEKKNLGIHTEMFSDGVLDLVKAGVINGSKKEIDRGKLVATFLMGTKELYDFANNNDTVRLFPVDYVNNPFTIMHLEHMVSINSCIEIDLFGQVCSETLGSKQFSGTGGQVDFVRGAAMSKEGISIMAMPSTAKKGTASRIVAELAPGAAVTTSRNDVDYVVTEYGVARLKGKNLRQRADALIAIAHPDFREELKAVRNSRFVRYR
ncbi:4-hydroxybutyrate CoA-transferase [Porphyromonas macacae]|uniref:acetyl-CoA hydrolase/transferase family protein n=1 Tax=Porphyromonas macacae TaxID=28115 RepID=UPI00052DD0C1|nr:acetyl-CoA hydrolase/transferase C-terminal domain-containing protein [Porphyromonas macacae]KGN99330.1 4-hydroxybutyrate CoA-transferase [Porphyromonas macacae]